MGARAALELATDENATGEEGRELLRRTRDELGQLSDLIDPLLRWSTGGEMLKRRRTDLVEVTREAVASSSLGMAPDRVLLEAPDRLFVRADPQQLKSAIANVVRNALMYSPTDTHVEVRVEFEEPIRAGSCTRSRTRRPSARPRDRVRSVQQGPRERPDAAWLRPRPLHRTDGCSRLTEARSPCALPSPERRSSSRCRRRGAVIRILIVDDHVLFADAISPALQRQGLDVIGVMTNGADALNAVRRDQPDAVLIDIGLPDQSGLVVGSQILKERPSVVVIAVTALEDGRLVKEAGQGRFPRPVVEGLEPAPVRELRSGDPRRGDRVSQERDP